MHDYENYNTELSVFYFFFKIFKIIFPGCRLILIELITSLIGQSVHSFDHLLRNLIFQKSDKPFIILIIGVASYE